MVRKKGSLSLFHITASAASCFYIVVVVTTQEGTRTEGEQGSQPKRLQAKEAAYDLAYAW